MKTRHVITTFDDKLAQALLDTAKLCVADFTYSREVYKYDPGVVPSALPSVRQMPGVTTSTEESEDKRRFHSR